MVTHAQDTPALRAALEAFNLGYTPIPLQAGDKRPALSSWQRTTYAEGSGVRAEWGAAAALDGPEPTNVGILLGAASGGLVDVDLDDRRALVAASAFLPVTSMRSGRLTNPTSHYWFEVTDDPGKTEKYTLPAEVDEDGRRRAGECIVELRATGGQTVIPPSVHPSGEAYTWSGEPFGGDAGPTRITRADLRARVLLIALTVTLADAWPVRGSRHDAYVALAGSLLLERTGEDSRQVNPLWAKFLPAVLTALADITQDDDGGEARIAECIPTTVRRIEDGQPTQGWPTLATLVGEDHADSARRLSREVERTLGYVRAQASHDGPDSLPAAPEPPDDGLGPEPGVDDVLPEAHRPKRDSYLALDLTNTHDYAEVRAAIRRLEVSEEASHRYTNGQAKPAVIDVVPLAMMSGEPDPLPRIDRFISWEGSTLMVAQAKTGKTTMCLNIVRSLLTGEKFLGEFDVRPIEEHRRVGMLNFEMTPAAMKNWCERRGIPVDRFVLLNQKGHGNPFRSDADRKRLAEQLREWDVETLIVDTFAAAYSGESQNDANEVRPWLEELHRWSREEVGAVDLILTAHAGWGDSGRVRGSSALMDWPDMSIFLTCEDPADKSAPRHVHTAGRAESLPKVQYAHVEETLEQRVIGLAAAQAAASVPTSITVNVSPIHDARRALIDVLIGQDGVGMTSSALKAAVQLRGVSKGNAEQAYAQGVREGYVRRETGPGNSASITLADSWEAIYRDVYGIAYADEES